jgi:hypothetical protein
VQFQGGQGFKSKCLHNTYSAALLIEGHLPILAFPDFLQESLLRQPANGGRYLLAGGKR